MILNQHRRLSMSHLWNDLIRARNSCGLPAIKAIRSVSKSCHLTLAYSINKLPDHMTAVTSFPVLICHNHWQVNAQTFGDSSMFPPDGVFLPEMVFSFVDDVSIVFCRRGGWELCELLVLPPWPCPPCPPEVVKSLTFTMTQHVTKADS